MPAVPRRRAGASAAARAEAEGRIEDAARLYVENGVRAQAVEVAADIASLAVASVPAARVDRSGIGERRFA